MRDIPAVEVLGVDVQDGSVIGRSQCQIARQALIRTDVEGIEIRVTDPMGTPLLEWRLDCWDTDDV